MYIYDMNINLIINHYINPYTLFRGVQYDFLALNLRGFTEVNTGDGGINGGRTIFCSCHDKYGSKIGY